MVIGADFNVHVGEGNRDEGQIWLKVSRKELGGYMGFRENRRQ